MEKHGFVGENIAHIQAHILPNLGNIAKRPHLDFAQLANFDAEDLFLNLHGESPQK